MECDIQGGKFIEFGEYKGNLYGTSTQSIKHIIHSAQIPILNPHSQALKMLRTKEFKPYIIYIKPPKFEVRFNYLSNSSACQIVVKSGLRFEMYDIFPY
jgi:guanylate kinase